MSCLPVIQQMLIEEFGLDAARVHAQATLEELGVDSLATVEFMFMLEDRYKLSMPGDSVVVKTVGDIAVEVDRLIAEQNIPDKV